MSENTVYGGSGSAGSSGGAGGGPNGGSGGGSNGGNGGSERGPLVEAWRTLMRSVGLGRYGTSAVRASLEELIEENGEDASPIDPHEGAIIRNVLGLRDITAYDVMVPRADIVAVDHATRLTDLSRQMSDVAHSRMPVFRDSLDDTIGMVHIKDVLAHLNRGDDVTAGALAREILIVAPSSRALDLLQEMRMTRRHMALVVDEYGGIDGLITIEDLIEEIVGDIVDEHDTEEGPKLVERSDGTVIADARATVEDLEELAGPFLSDEEREEIDTLGGLVFSLAGRVATRGEVIRHPSGIEFEVMDGDPRRLRRLKVRVTQQPAVGRAAE
ncbi:MAG: hemolysin family protein [Alphaproteobacteria bacterium]|nr:hemolysin family protein [Alphaproteobacteria bacterium]